MAIQEWSARKCLDAWLRNVHKRSTLPIKTPTKPIRHEKDVTLPMLKEAYTVAAKAVADHGEVYLPIFERLHNEIEERQARDKMLAAAIEIAVDKS